MFTVIVGAVLLVSLTVFLWLVERHVARYAIMIKKCRLFTREIPLCDIAIHDNTGHPILVQGYSHRVGDSAGLKDIDTGFAGPDMISNHRLGKREVIRLMRRGREYSS